MIPLARYILTSVLILTSLTTTILGIFTIPNFDTQVYSSDGDVNIASINAVRNKATITPTSPAQCGPIRNDGIVMFNEIMADTIRKVNKEQLLLPNITIGWAFLDDCSVSTLIAARALQFLKPDANMCNDVNSVPGNRFKSYDALGVVGSGYSSQVMSLTSFLGTFKIPVLGTFATSDELNNRKRFPYFARSIPSDKYQARVVVDILDQYNWTYVNLVVARGSYGEKAAETILALSAEKDICITYYTILDDDMSTYSNVTSKLVADKKVNVIVMFLYNYMSIRFVKELDSKVKDGRKFAFIAADDIRWSIARTYKHLASTFFFIDMYGEAMSKEDEMRIKSLNVNTVNPFISNLIQEQYNCNKSSGVICNASLNFGTLNPYKKLYYSSIYTGHVMTLIKAARLLILEVCPEIFKSKHTRDEIKACISKRELMPYINRVMALTSPRYQIRQVNEDDEGDSLTTRRLGVWDLYSMTLNLNKDLVQWSIPSGQLPLESICAYPCKIRQYRLQLELKCCWECRYCIANEIIIKNGTRCEQCPEFQWPDAVTATECLDISWTYLKWDSITTIVIAVISFTGMLICLITFLFFLIKRSTRLIKATSIHLSLVTLLGVVIAYPSALLLVIPPTSMTCKISTIGMHLSFCITYASLLTKANRIFRVFQAAKHSAKKPKLISNSFMITVTFVLIMIQIFIIMMTSFMYPLKLSLRMQRPTEAFVELMCDLPKESFIPPMCFNLVLIVICSVYAVKTRKLPDNFNESKLIFLHVMATSFLWMAFLPTYFSAVDAIQKTSLLAMFLLISSTLALLCLHMPKMYATIYMDMESMKMTRVTASSTESSSTG